MIKKDIHIVYNPNKGDIVSRLMTTLAEQTGWTIDKSPRAGADINYFGLYISVAQGMNRVASLRGQIVAYFSHYEPETPQKMIWWESASKFVDIRLTCAPQYLDRLKNDGETHLIIPPVDSQFITYEIGKTKTIGVSGFVHPNGRKGEHLVARLHEDKKSIWNIVASGNGWGVDDIQNREWRDMPSYYRSLDVFLVTSLTEGIPMPPLEALSCNVPVVIPYGVGLLDYLNNNHVYRYEPNNYDDMLRAISDALYPARSISEFSISNWVESHRRAFGISEDRTPILLSKPKNNEPFKTIWHNERHDIKNAGAVVVAYGDPARECAKVLIESWYKYMDGYPIALISDSPLGLESLFIEHADLDIGGRAVKTMLPKLLPKSWEYVLYLDSDTELVNDVSIFFKWVQNFEFVICSNPSRFKTLADGLRPDNKDEMELTANLVGSADVVIPNGGVFAFQNNSVMESFFELWHTEWNRFGKRDQMALLRAMYEQPLRWLFLTNIWNTIIFYMDKSESAGILHKPMSARRWTGLIDGRLDSDNAWQSVNRWNNENKKGTDNE